MWNARALLLLGTAVAWTACGARTDLNVGDADETETEPEPEPCGNGKIEPGEACDDGNNVDGDGCEANCTLLSCGDGVVDPGEACDQPDRTQCTEICTIPFCGDGLLSPLEGCDDGPDNGPRIAALLLSIDHGPEEPIAPIHTFQAPGGFYSYQSVSAHTGFEEPFASNLFVYAESNVSGLSLFTVHNIDVDSSGISTGEGRASQVFTGLPPGAFILLSDEPDETTLELDATTASAVWQWQDNTDGAVLGGLPFPGEWSIDVESEFVRGIDRLRFIAPDAFLDVDLGSLVTIIAHTDGPRCTLECTAIVCGDGIVDAGEACDDGNQLGGDGCSADCSVFD